MKKHSLLFTLILDLAVVAFALSAPHLLRTMLRGVPNCWSLQIGIICPACGGTRCILNLLKFNLHKAFVLNPMVVLIIAYLFIVLVSLNLSAFTKKKVFATALRKLTNHRLIIILAVAFVVLGILRNFVFGDFFLSVLIHN